MRAACFAGRERKTARRTKEEKQGGRLIRKGGHRNDCGVLVVRVTFFCLARRKTPCALYASRMLHVQRSRRKKKKNHKEEKEEKQDEEEV